MPSEWIKPSDAAKIMDVTSETIVNYAKRGRIRYRVLPSGHRRFLRSDVEAVAAASIVEPTA